MMSEKPYIGDDAFRAQPAKGRWGTAATLLYLVGGGTLLALAALQTDYFKTPADWTAFGFALGFLAVLVWLLQFQVGMVRNELEQTKALGQKKSFQLLADSALDRKEIVGLWDRLKTLEEQKEASSQTVLPVDSPAVVKALKRMEQEFMVLRDRFNALEKMAVAPATGAFDGERIERMLKDVEVQIRPLHDRLGVVESLNREAGLEVMAELNAVRAEVDMLVPVPAFELAATRETVDRTREEVSALEGRLRALENVQPVAESLPFDPRPIQETLDLAREEVSALEERLRALENVQPGPGSVPFDPGPIQETADLAREEVSALEMRLRALENVQPVAESLPFDPAPVYAAVDQAWCEIGALQGQVVEVLGAAGKVAVESRALGDRLEVRLENTSDAVFLLQAGVFELEKTVKHAPAFDPAPIYEVVDGARKEAGYLLDKQEALQARIKMMFSEMENKLLALENERAVPPAPGFDPAPIEDNMERIKEKVGKLEGWLMDLEVERKELQKATRDVRALHERLGALEKMNTGASFDPAPIQKAMLGLEEEAGALRERIKVLEKKKAGPASAVSDAARFEKALGKIEEQTVLLGERLKELEKKRPRPGPNAEVAEEKLVDLQRIIAKNEESLDECNTFIYGLQLSISTLEKQLNELKEKSG